MDRELSFVSAVYLVGNPLHCPYIEVFLGGSNVFGYRPFYRYGGDIEFIRRSIMGCPGGTRSVFSHAFGAKENFTVYFSRKRHALLNPNTAQRSCNLFLGKLKEKLARKARVNTE